jgi:two-component system sensor histidine kinase DctS
MNEAPPSLAGTRRLGWLLALPKLAIVLLVAALLSLLALLHHNEQDEERAALIKDVLWLEQNLRFHLSGNEEQLQQLALDMVETGEAQRLFRLRAGHMLKNAPDIAQILWLDAQRHVIDALPSPLPPEQDKEAFGPTATADAFERARLLSKASYSEPFLLPADAPTSRC